MSTTTAQKADSTRLYLADKAYAYLIGRTQRAKLGQIQKNVDIEGTNTRLIKDIIQSDGRFVCIDRRWTLSGRFGESSRPFEQVINGIFTAAGCALSLETLAAELAQVLGRPAEAYEEMLQRFLKDKDRYFQTSDGKYGITSWLVFPTAEEEDDVIFDNFIDNAQVEEYSKKCPAIKWDSSKYAENAEAVIKKCGQLPIKILQLFAWRALKEDFDPTELFDAISEDDKLLLQSDLFVYPGASVKNFQKDLVKQAEELAKLPMDEDDSEAEGPIVVTETEKEEIINIILSSGSASAEKVMEQVLEVSPNEASFAGAYESLKEALANDYRVMWIGGDQWSKVIEFPEEVTTIPMSLIIPQTLPFETAEGDIYDQLLETEGFEGELKSAILDPLAEDVTDEDPDRTMYQENEKSQRCVLKYHHKLEGTFPLCQIHPDFFGKQPEIIPITVVHEGKRKQAFVNNATRLIYGLKDFYAEITDVSGAVFFLEKTERTGEYKFVYTGELDEQCGIDTGRSLELLDVKARFEGGEMPLYDVMTEILIKKQGRTFASLYTEMNIVKRCSRLMVASLLSGYHCFSTRGKTGLWQYDEKKVSQGFNKSKRKYIKK